MKKFSTISKLSTKDTFEKLLEAKIESEKDFRDWAKAVLQNAFKDKFDEAKYEKVVNDLIKKHGDNYGAMIGSLSYGLAESMITEDKTFANYDKYFQMAEKVYDTVPYDKLENRKLVQSALKKHGYPTDPLTVGQVIRLIQKEINESLINEADVKSDADFKKYAETVLKKAFGDKYDEKIASKMINDLLNKYKDDYGAMIGALNNGLAESMITEDKTFANYDKYFQMAEKVYDIVPYDKLENRKLVQSALKKHGYPTDPLTVGQVIRLIQKEIIGEGKAESSELAIGTRILYIPYRSREPRLTPGVIVKKHTKGTDWYVVADDKGENEELLQHGSTARRGRYFEVVVYEQVKESIKITDSILQNSIPSSLYFDDEIEVIPNNLLESILDKDVLGKLSYGEKLSGSWIYKDFLTLDSNSAKVIKLETEKLLNRAIKGENPLELFKEAYKVLTKNTSKQYMLKINSGMKWANENYNSMPELKEIVAHTNYNIKELGAIFDLKYIYLLVDTVLNINNGKTTII